MRKFVLSAAAGLIAAASFAPALAKGKPGQGTMPAQSVYGLCKAYFAGRETGTAHKRNAPPFKDLVVKAGDNGVEEFCRSATPGGK